MNTLTRTVAIGVMAVGLLVGVGCSSNNITNSASVTCLEYNAMTVSEQGEALDSAIRANGQDPGTIAGIGILEMGLQDRCRSTANAYTPIEDLLFGDSDQTATKPDPAPTDVVFDQPKKKMPKNAKEVWLTDSDSFEKDCQTSLDKGHKGRLQISVPKGDATYFVKLKAAPGGFVGADTFGVTVRPGKTVTVDVPLCGFSSLDYFLYYGAGTTWYGYEYLFGPAGAYSRADEVFPFQKGTGWEVELILQPGGNLGAEGINYNDFVD